VSMLEKNKMEEFKLRELVFRFTYIVFVLIYAVMMKEPSTFSSIFGNIIQNDEILGFFLHENRSIFSDIINSS
jgi:hypothetical protein